MAQITESVPGRESDPRVLKGQVERAAKALRGCVVASPPWVLLFALSCGTPLSYLGKVPLENLAVLVFTVLAASALGYLSLRAYYGKSDHDDAGVERWRRRFLLLSILLSSAWGLSPWLLWDDVNNTNHVFILLICVGVVLRFLVNRATQATFFFASFLPLACLLFWRFLMTDQPVDMVLALIVPLYGLQIYLDSRHISDRWDQEASIRFAHEDMALQLAEARDEALLKRAEAEAANTSKTSFLANMSHELRTPLNAILGFSEIISRECLGPVGSPRYREYAGDIHNSGTHLLSLINDLLDVAKIEAGRMEIQPQIIDAGRALNSALKFVGVKARERGQELTISVDHDATTIFADERALKQIVINLVSNAVKFTREGGKIQVHASRKPSGEFLLMVADNGSGIPADKIGQIFKPFSRVDNRYDSETGGTGLGLALVRGLTELHGGRAWMESELGVGTRVYVAMPMEVTPETIKRRA